MFEKIKNQYLFINAKDEFYDAWSGDFVKDFTPCLDRKYLEKVNNKYLGLEEEPFNALCEAAKLMAEEYDLCQFAACCRAVLLF